MAIAALIISVGFPCQIVKRYPLLRIREISLDNVMSKSESEYRQFKDKHLFILKATESE